MNKVLSNLEELNIEYKLYEHEAVFTVEEAEAIDIEIPGAHCKNLFLRNRKGNVHYLVILESQKRLDLKSLSKKINSTSLSLASSERLMKHLGVIPGSVTVFGLINDLENTVELIVDQDLKKFGTINFHPNVNTATINIKYEDFEKFVKSRGKNIKYLEF
ncbi:MAG: prolyl-tRNA synthetase associated domain-containing protein [Firmicutes bacterium]|jgi:Ala-tRNA(Pro) deacylase|nr:prolyl-tRNA synthetase associated domain-containing protein [Bacillota bacterium]